MSKDIINRLLSKMILISVQSENDVLVMEKNLTAFSGRISVPDAAVEYLLMAGFFAEALILQQRQVISKLSITVLSAPAEVMDAWKLTHQHREFHEGMLK